LPVVRGLALTRDDTIRRAVIMTIMCQGEVLFESINSAWLIDFKKYFASEIEALASQQEEGLVEILDDCIKVTAKGWFFVRGVALVFDRYLQADRNRARFSRII
ncbi:MAG: coproporphyrinogen III oxidase, partial [Comamonas sp.]